MNFCSSAEPTHHCQIEISWIESDPKRNMWNKLPRKLSSITILFFFYLMERSSLLVLVFVHMGTIGIERAMHMWRRMPLAQRAILHRDQRAQNKWDLYGS
jgi:hypothetical protein